MLMPLPERIDHFDRYVESVDEALRNPRVYSVLGSLATRLLAVNSSAFLPNVRDGALVAPASHQEDQDLALFPIARSEAHRLSRLTSPMLSIMGETVKVPDAHITSPVSGVRVKTSAALQLAQYAALGNETNYQPDTPTSMQGKNVGRTLGNFALSIGDQGTSYHASRPITVINADHFNAASPEDIAAMVAHEYAHAIDLRDTPLVYQHPLGHAGSELVGYHVTDTIQRLNPQDTEAHKFAREVEEWRRSHTQPSAPFTLALEDTFELERWGVI